MFFGDWKAGYRENFEIFVKDVNNNAINNNDIKSYNPDLNGKSNNILLSAFKKYIC